MNNAKLYKTFLRKLGFINGMKIYNLKNDDDGDGDTDKDELVCYTPEAEVIEEIPCKQGVITTKKPFRNDKGNIYYNDALYSITQGLSEEILKGMVELLNRVYQTGFSEGATLMLNK